jgi:hypothetical protein
MSIENYNGFQPSMQIIKCLKGVTMDIVKGVEWLNVLDEHGI